MAIAELSTLEQRAYDVAKQSALGDRVQGVTMESDRYDESGDFLRIQVGINNLDTATDDEIDAIVASIENAVRELDDRFPSVRFNDPGRCD